MQQKIAFTTLKLFITFILYFASIAQAQIKVGISAPLTGDLAEYGAAVRQGIESAVAENQDAFKNVRFIFEDNQYEGAKAVSAFQKLKNIGAVNLIYNWGEPTLHSIAPIAETQKLPIIAMSLDPAPAIGKKYIIRSINYSEQYAIKLIEYLREKGLKNIAIFKTEDPFLNSMMNGLKKHLVEGETLEEFATFNPEEQDFKSQIARLKAHRFDVIGVYLITGQVSQFYRQARSLDLRLPTFGTDFFESKTEILHAQGGMNGAFYPNIDVPKEFADNYLKHYGNDAQIAYAYNAYTFAKLTSVLFHNSDKDLTSDEIMNRYANPPKNLGFNFTDTKNGGRFYEFPLVIKKIDGKRD